MQFIAVASACIIPTLFCFFAGILFVSAGRVWGRGFSPAASVARRRRHVVPWPSTARTLLPGSGEQPISATYVISLSLSLSLSHTHTKLSLCPESCTTSVYADIIRWTWTSSQCQSGAAATLLIGWLSQCFIPLPWEVPCPSEITTSSVATFACPFAACNAYRTVQMTTWSYIGYYRLYLLLITSCSAALAPCKMAWRCTLEWAELLMFWEYKSFSNKHWHAPLFQIQVHRTVTN